MAWTKTKVGGSKSRAEEVIILKEEAADDSDKVLDFDTDINEGVAFEVEAVRVEYVATATAGERRLNLQVRDGAADILQVLEFADTAAANATTNYQAAPGLTPASGTDVSYETLPDNFTLRPGQDLRLFDAAAVDAAADDVTLIITGRLLR